MSKEMTAEEYLRFSLQNNSLSAFQIKQYKQLVEKEAVKEFAVALLNAIPDLDVHNAIILELRKQKGVEI
jgi:hypothetical protein